MSVAGRPEMVRAVTNQERQKVVSLGQQPVVGERRDGDAEAWGDRSDGELMKGVGHQSEDAYAELYRRHATSVAAVSRMVLGQGGPSDEVVADVFVGLWLSPGSFDPTRGSLLTFLRLKARRRSIDVLRSERSRSRREQRDGRDAPVPASAVDSGLLATERAVELRSAVGSLREVEREAVRLAFFEGMTYRDVAAYLNVAEGTVKSRIRNGLRHLSQSDTVRVYRQVARHDGVDNLSSLGPTAEGCEIGPM